MESIDFDHGTSPISVILLLLYTLHAQLGYSTMSKWQFIKMCH